MSYHLIHDSLRSSLFIIISIGHLIALSESFIAFLAILPDKNFF